MTSNPYTDHPYVYTTTDTAINTMQTSTYELINVGSTTFKDYIVDRNYVSAIEFPQPAPVIVSLQIETCKYDADSRTLFAFTPPRNELGYPQTQPWPDELKLMRHDATGLRAFKAVLVASRVIPVPKQQEMADDTYSLYRDEANDAWVRLYESEKLRDYYFAMYRATKKNPYP